MGNAVGPSAWLAGKMQRLMISSCKGAAIATGIKSWLPFELVATLVSIDRCMYDQE